METTYLTKERFEELKKELEQLKTTGRKEIAVQLKNAKDLGDLSENAEYDEVRNLQAQMEQRILTIEGMLRNSRIIEEDRIKTDSIHIGSKVTVKKGSESREYTIVGSSEARPQEGFISNVSPLGKMLLGRKAGEKIMVETPKGSMSYLIAKVD